MADDLLERWTDVRPIDFIRSRYYWAPVGECRYDEITIFGFLTNPVSIVIGDKRTRRYSVTRKESKQWPVTTEFYIGRESRLTCAVGLEDNSEDYYLTRFRAICAVGPVNKIGTINFDCMLRLGPPLPNYEVRSIYHPVPVRSVKQSGELERDHAIRDLANTQSQLTNLDTELNGGNIECSKIQDIMFADVNTLGLYVVPDILDLVFGPTYTGSHDLLIHLLRSKTPNQISCTVKNNTTGSPSAEMLWDDLFRLCSLESSRQLKMMFDAVNIGLELKALKYKVKELSANPTTQHDLLLSQTSVDHLNRDQTETVVKGKPKRTKWNHLPTDDSWYHRPFSHGMMTNRPPRMTRRSHRSAATIPHFDSLDEFPVLPPRGRLNKISDTGGEQPDALERMGTTGKRSK